MDQSEQPLTLVKATTLAENLKFNISTKILPLAASLPNRDFAEDRFRRFVAMLDPWPEWALRIAGEVISVHFPRVKKRSILETLKIIHWVLFEAEMLGDIENSPQITSEFPKIDFPPDARQDIFSFFAHLQKHAGTLITISEDAKTKSQAWNEQDEKSLDNLRRGYEEMAKTLLKLLGDEPPENHVPTMGTIIAADKATYDEHGRVRDTTATGVYKQILKSWPEIATFSGVNELCDFLDPVLGNGDAEAKLDRVKKIVKRMRIKFRARQGTA